MLAAASTVVAMGTLQEEAAILTKVLTRYGSS
jgi:hypothetical protein